MRCYLSGLRNRPVNFDTPIDLMTLTNGWTIDGGDDEIGTEAEGPPVPDGIFDRAKHAIINYDFSDPTVLAGHFDPHVGPVGRDMLLELKVLGFRFLCGVPVHSVREEYEGNTSYFGFRYDTLEGNIERGFERFLLTKDDTTGGPISGLKPIGGWADSRTGGAASAFRSSASTIATSGDAGPRSG